VTIQTGLKSVPGVQFAAKQREQWQVEKKKKMGKKGEGGLID